MGLDAFLDALIVGYGIADADIVGFTSMFAQNTAGFAMARKLKERNPRITTVMGGSACEGVTGLEFARRVDAVDAFFSGPALVSFPEFVRRRIEGATPSEPIPGVFGRSDTVGSAAEDVTVGAARDINAVPKVDFRDFLLRFGSACPAGEQDPILLFETSRGCRWGQAAPCAFCGLNGLSAHYRAMSPEAALRQFDELAQYASRSSLWLGCDNLMPPNYPSEVFPRLRLPAEVTLRYEVRPDLSRAELGIMAEAGIRYVQPGIESLCTATLKLMRKGLTAFRNIRFLVDCLATGVTPEWNLLIGTPGEPEPVYAKLLEDIPHLVHLPPPTGVFPVEIVRFSHYFDRAGVYGLALRPHDFYRLTYPFDASAVGNIARRFVDDHTDQDMLNTWLDRLGNAVGEWQACWRDPEDRGAPALMLDGGIISDSRGVQNARYTLDPIATAVLAALERPTDMAAVAEECGISRAEAEGAMSWLDDRRLIFTEGARYMSLVPNS